MITFGPWVRYPDPRVYDLIAGYAWGPHQRAMLLGTRPWPNNAQANVMSIVACLRERGIRVGRTPEGVAHVRMDGLPPDDPLLPELRAQWRVITPGVHVLSLEGPVEVVGGVPILRGVAFGYVEGADGLLRHGLHRDAWVVGRGDVRHVVSYTLPGGRSMHPDEPVARRHVRGTLARARNTAAKVAAALPRWESYLAHKAVRDAAALAARVAEEAVAEPEDEGVLAMAP